MATMPTTYTPMTTRSMVASWNSGMTYPQDCVDRCSRECQANRPGARRPLGEGPLRSGLADFPVVVGVAVRALVAPGAVLGRLLLGGRLPRFGATQAGEELRVVVGGQRP